MWDATVVQLTNAHVSEFFLSSDARFINSNNEYDFNITTIYGTTALNWEYDFIADSDVTNNEKNPTHTSKVRPAGL